MVKRRPQSDQAHFIGIRGPTTRMLGQDIRECDIALQLDPGNYLFRSCAWAFLYKGNTQRAREIISWTPAPNGRIG